jgi:hypothetical protein
MVELRKQRKPAVKLYCILVLLFGYGCSFAQTPALTVVAKERGDSVAVSIKSNLQSDTVLFSLYSQTKVNKKWVTSNYDLFCDVSNPNTSIFIINPNQQITLVAARPAVIYSNKNIKTGKSMCTNCRRIILIGNSKRNDAIEYKAFSNTQ